MRRALNLIIITICLVVAAAGAAHACGLNKRDISAYFMSKRNGYYGIYRFKNGKVEKLFDSADVLKVHRGLARYQIAYDLSPDGRYITFNAVSNNENMDIFLLDLETKKLINLTNDSATDILPIFSHDGKWIAYLSHRKGMRGYENIFLVSTDGNKKIQLTHDYSNIISLEFSPDDIKILFVKYFPFHSAISIVNIKLKTVRDLTSYRCANRVPHFSPDGSTIVFASNCFGTFDIWLMNSDGLNKRILYRSPGFEYEPIFTKNGRSVIFHSNLVPDKYPGINGNTIYMINLDRTHLRNILPNRYLRHNFLAYYPRVTNKDDYISFQGNYSKDNKMYGEYNVYLLNLKNGRVYRIFKDKYNDTEPIVRFAKGN